jgi:hypothetical protein
MHSACEECIPLKKRAFINIAFAKYAARKKSLEFSKKKNTLKLPCTVTVYRIVEKFRAMRAVLGKNKITMRRVLTDRSWMILALEWKQSP